jgi:pyruvate/2-oxoglutarate dehydrogenase complex dihydrolipoamide acyltransferase (E2) component
LVRTRDIVEYLGEAPPNPQHSPTAHPGQSGPPQPAEGAVPAVGVAFRTVALSRVKRTENRLLRSAHQNVIPSFVSVAVPTRGLRAAAAGNHQLLGNATAVILFEVSRLLRKYPVFNAFHSDGAANYYERINIGFAIDAGNGLKVPIIQDADQKSLPEAAAEMQERLVEYLSDQLRLENLAAGTFTITDLSGQGVFEFMPVLNRGQSAILGVGGEMIPSGRDDGMYHLILAFDHQLADGRQAARFLNDLRQRLHGYEAALVPPRAASGSNAEEPHCSECLMPVRELRGMGAFLLQKLNPDGSLGRVCSICAAGF